MLREGRRALSRATASGRTARRWRLIGAAAALGTIGAGCSLLYDLSTEQCNENLDCVNAFGPNYTCNAVHVCEAPQIGATGGTGGDGGSGGTEQTGGSAGADPAGSGGSAGETQTGCTSNDQCITENSDQPFVCRAGTCVNLLSDECPFILAGTNLSNLRSESPIIIGAYTYIDQNAGVTNSPSTANYELALTEFTEKVGGLNEGRRQFAIIGCDGINSSTFQASLDHLIDVAQVPGIIAPLFSNDLATLFNAKGHDSNVFFLSPIEADSRITLLSDDSLIWNILGSAAQLAPSYVPLLQRTELYLHNQPAQALAPTDPIRVALVVDETVYQRDIFNELIGTSTPLSYNGKTLSENQDTDSCGTGVPCFKGVQIPSAGVAGDYTDAIDTLNAYQPHVIIALAGSAFVTNVMEPLEAIWADTNPVRPFYLMSPYPGVELRDAVVASTPTATRCNGSPCPLTGRVLGINFESARDPAVLNSYRTRFNLAYSGLPDNFENFYDATWYMFYAIAAAGNSQLTGSSIARGMDRLIETGSPTAKFKVGPEDAPQAVYSLVTTAAATHFEIDGAMGPPDFDPGTGARRTLGSAYCLTQAGTTRYDVMRYDSTDSPPSMTTPVANTCVPSGF